jgi:hypothetical protein
VYNSAATYWANGALNTLQLSTCITNCTNTTNNTPVTPLITYNADGKGRPSMVSASFGQNPVTATTYNSANLPTALTFGSADTDAPTYDPNTFRMTKYQFNVNGQAYVGALTWNANGSLTNSVAIASGQNIFVLDFRPGEMGIMVSNLTPCNRQHFLPRRGKVRSKAILFGSRFLVREKNKSLRLFQVPIREVANIVANASAAGLEVKTKTTYKDCTDPTAFSVRFNFPSACDSIRVLLPAHDHIQLFCCAVLVGLDLYRVISAYLNFVMNLGSPVHKISNLNLGLTLNGEASSVAGLPC